MYNCHNIPIVGHLGHNLENLFMASHGNLWICKMVLPMLSVEDRVDQNSLVASIIRNIQWKIVIQISMHFIVDDLLKTK